MPRMRGTTVACLLAASLLAQACSSGGGGGSDAPSPGRPTPLSPPASRDPSSTGPPPASPTGGPPSSPSGVELELEPFLEGLQAPLYLTHAGDGTGRLYVLEQEGRIRVAEADGTVLPGPFLDITDRVSSGGERGLLGLAFHPDHAENGLFYVDYTDLQGDTVIAELARRDAARADPGSERVLLRIDQPFPNHNGGQVAFGPDGFLYVGMGDGGSGGDPMNNGQRTDTLLGKILRIDVDGGRPYGIPPDNPFAGGGEGRPEIWDLGLRNPWRFSFDRKTGDVFVGDVGQVSWEEIDVHPAASPGGLNFGWNVTEGGDCYAATSCDRDGLVGPVAEYPHQLGCSVIGGYVYRGREWPALRGVYLFADFCSGRIWTLSARRALRGEGQPVEALDTDMAISSIGEDEAGELYVTDLVGGTVHRVTAEPPEAPR